MFKDKSLVLIKPDGVQRRLIGRILQRFEDAGLVICASKMFLATKELAAEHYAEHKGKVFFPLLLDFITESPCLALVLAGDDVVERVRCLLGSTEPASSLPGTIRGDFSHQKYHTEGKRVICNLVHASANKEDAKREINLWFKKEEVIDYMCLDGKYMSPSK